MDKKWTIGSAMPTPFCADGSLDLESLARVVEHHVAIGVDTLFIAGTCSEGPVMPSAQRTELIAAVKGLVAGRLRVTAQVSDTSAARVIDNIAQAADAGADAVVIAPPWIERFCSEPFVRRYFEEPIVASTVPVGIYVLRGNIAALTPTVWAGLAADSRVSLVKDSSSCLEHATALAAVRARRPDLLLQTGDEFDVISTAKLGYDGAMLGSGIVNAIMIRHALDALAAGDEAAALAWQERSNTFLRDLFRPDISGWLAGLKYTLVQLGLFTTDTLHLGYSTTPADHARIAAAITRERAHIMPQ